MSDELTLEQKKERVKDFRPIDDVFFEVLADDKEVCEEILRTIMEDKNLVVEDVIVQSSERNLYGRSVRLDALCKLSDGKKCNIEVQRSENDDNLRRARYNASVITTKDSQTDTKFSSVEDLYIIFISEHDFLKGGKTIYHVDKVLRETQTIIDDGLHEIFVNTAVDDGSDIADLMTCFVKKAVENPKFPKLSERVTYLKNDEGGVSAMCDVMERYNKVAREEGRKEGIADKAKEVFENLVAGGMSVSQASQYTGYKPSN